MLIKNLLEDENIECKKIYINFDDLYEREFTTKHNFMEYISFHYEVDFLSKGILFLDEVQTIENIEQILKSLYDDENIKL